MRTKGFVGFALLIFGVLASAKPQQHAPTVEVCRADVALWYDDDSATEYFRAETLHKSDRIKNLTPIAKLSLVEVKARGSEMYDCRRVDKPQSQNYLEAADFYFIVMVDRYAEFLRRHHLMEQLFKEDAQGLR
jgi:uncharacterized protein YtpQ (UPF0354 family)